MVGSFESLLCEEVLQLITRKNKQKQRKTRVTGKSTENEEVYEREKNENEEKNAWKTNCL